MPKMRNVCVCVYLCVHACICVLTCVCVCVRSGLLLRMRDMFSLPDNLPLHPQHVDWGGTVVGWGGGWEENCYSHWKTCLHTDAEFRGTYSYEGDTPHCWELASLQGKSCYSLFYLSEFCTKTLRVLRSHFSFFASHTGEFDTRSFKGISNYFLFSDII